MSLKGNIYRIYCLKVTFVDLHVNWKKKNQFLRNKDLSKSRSTPLEANLIWFKENRKKLNYKSTRHAIKNDDGNRWMRKNAYHDTHRLL